MGGKFQVQLQLFRRFSRKDFVNVCCALCVVLEFMCAYCYFIVARYFPGFQIEHGRTNIGFYNAVNLGDNESDDKPDLNLMTL